MKTLTEFSGTLIRMASKAAAQARSALPKEAFSTPAAEGAVTAQPTEGADPAAVAEPADSVTDAADQALAGATAEGEPAVDPAHHAKPGEAGSDEEGSRQDPDAVAREEESVAGQDLAGSGAKEAAESERAAAAPAPRAPAVETESEMAKTALDEAVGKATGMTGDRLQRLREAVRAVGRQAERVRLVRVFSGEEPVSGATKIGEHQYVVDLMPHSMKQVFERDEKQGKRGPKRPMGNPKTKEGSLEGSFSMESVAADRRNERGGPGGRKPGGPGGGRGGKPGGRPGGKPGGRGGRPGGSPSKP